MLLGIYVHTKTYTGMFTAALSINAKNLENNHSVLGEWIHLFGYIRQWQIIQHWKEMSTPTMKRHVKWKCKSLSRVHLCCPMDYTVHGILQARILEWVAIPFSRGSFPPRERTQVSRIAGGFFTSWATREAQRNLKCISRSERKQSEEGRHCMIPTKWHSRKGQTMEVGKRSVVARGWGNGRDEEVEQRAL